MGGGLQFQIEIQGKSKAVVKLLWKQFMYIKHTHTHTFTHTNILISINQHLR